MGCQLLYLFNVCSEGNLIFGALEYRLLCNLALLHFVGSQIYEGEQTDSQSMPTIVIVCAPIDRQFKDVTLMLKLRKHDRFLYRT